jgi:chromosome segregation ATPase
MTTSAANDERRAQITARMIGNALRCEWQPIAICAFPNSRYFYLQHERNHRKGNSMTVELEEFAAWRHRVDARLGTLEKVSDEHGDKIGLQQGSFLAIHADLGEIRGQLRKQDGMIQALHLTQSEHSTALRELRTGQDELRRDMAEVRQDMAEVRQDMTEVRQDMTEVREGIRTIVDLIERTEDGDDPGRGQHGQKRE